MKRAGCLVGFICGLLWSPVILLASNVWLALTLFFVCWIIGAGFMWFIQVATSGEGGGNENV